MDYDPLKKKTTLNLEKDKTKCKTLYYDSDGTNTETNSNYKVTNNDIRLLMLMSLAVHGRANCFPGKCVILSTERNGLLHFWTSPVVGL